MTSVNISSRINVPDGGVDAAIDSEVPLESGLAKTGRTVFQLKAGQFYPWQQAVIHKQLFGQESPVSKDYLGEPVRACLDAGGSFVLACTGVDLTKSQRTDAVKHIVRAYEECGYIGPRVDVLSQKSAHRTSSAIPVLEP